MTDVELEVADSFERVFPVPTVVADWDDVLDRAGARSRTPHPAALALAGRRHRRSDRRRARLLVTPALGIGGRLLDLIRERTRAARGAGSCLVARRADGSPS